MPVERDRWTKTFTEKDPPEWACANCGTGSLEVAKGSLHMAETRDSIIGRDHEAWEPEWIEKRFVCLLRCTRSQCREVTAVAGTTVAEEYYTPDPDNPYGYIEHGITERLQPRYVSPPPALFRFPPGTPEPVRKELVAAFLLFWTDTGACANKLRSSLEVLMDHFKVRKRVKDKKSKKMRRLDLHVRITEFRPRAPNVADLLLAAKWIGNAGVHAAELSRADVFDAMDLIEHSLVELIEKRSTKLTHIAKSIAKRKGPRKT